VQKIEVEDKIYRYYVGEKLVSVEQESVIYPGSGKTFFGAKMPSAVVGKAIAATQKGLSYTERADKHTIIKQVTVDECQH
jgi:hypothetical protein